VRARRVAWAAPLAAFVLTYGLVAGVSLSNIDVRQQAEVAGLVALAACPLAGLVLTRRVGMPLAGWIVNSGLLVLVALFAWLAYAARQPIDAVPRLPVRHTADATARPLPLWIDTDPACGAGARADVDDCWALAFALRSPQLRVLGISTVFGNQAQDRQLSASQRVDLVRTLIARAGHGAPVFAGAQQRGGGEWPRTPASVAMASALAQTPLTIVALGPATNLAALLQHHAEHARNIERIILVAGKRPGRLFHPGRHWWFHFGDFNVAQDVDAMRAVLRSGVPITLVPFEIGMQVDITAADLERLQVAGSLAGWLAEVSQPWLSFWRGRWIERAGFSPFDALAVGHAAQPQHFECKAAHARIGFSVFLAPLGLGRDLEVADDSDAAPVRYCDTVHPAFKRALLDRLLN
jgi:inosine-uridine nucleoside N-ribohydrolase